MMKIMQQQQSLRFVKAAGQYGRERQHHFWRSRCTSTSTGQCSSLSTTKKDLGVQRQSRPFHHLRHPIFRSNTTVLQQHQHQQQQRYSKAFTSSSSSTSKAITNQVNHEPPLPIRVALVSTSTALCTPIFPAIGFVNAFLRVFFKSDPQTRSNLTATFGTVFNIAFWSIMPYSYQIAPLLLPFALGNGLAAGGAYALLDGVSRVQSRVLASSSSSSSSKFSINPIKHPIITGGGIGAFTGLIAPPFLYGPSYTLLYGMDGSPISEAITEVFTTTPLITEISVATGFTAGLIMYPMLHYPMHGIPNVSWPYFTGMALLASAALLHHVYTTDNENYLPFADDFFVDPLHVPLLDSIVRYDVPRGKFGLYSLKTNEWIKVTTTMTNSEKSDSVNDSAVMKMKERGQELAEFVRNNEYYNTHTMDNQVLALLCNFADERIAERYPDCVVTAMTLKELQKYEDSMYRTDWLVESLVGSQSQSRMEKKGKRSATTAQVQPPMALSSPMDDFEDKVEQFKMYGSKMSLRERRRRVKNIHDTSKAVQLLMAMRRDMEMEKENDDGLTKKNRNVPWSSLMSSISKGTTRSGTHNSNQKDSDIPTMEQLEKWIQNHTPDVILYESHEKEWNGLKGQSVESQLKKMGWRPPATKDALEECREMQGEVKRSKVKKMVVNGLIVSAGLLVSQLLQM